MWNKNLYKEGLRQSTLVGIIFASILLLGAFVFPISNIAQARRSGRIMIIEYFQFNPLLVGAFCLFAPLCTLSLFSFLNRRNRSDFYHSLPYKRGTIFFSYLTSVLTWVIGTVLCCSFITFTIYFFGADAVSLNFAQIFAFLFNIVSACIMVTGAVLLAMSITGTLFSNIMTALLIIFLPRTILSLFFTTLSRLTLVTSAASYGLLGQAHYNIPFGFVLGIFNGSTDMALCDFHSGLYTLIVGLVYTAVAAFAFKHRKSETSGMPAPNRRVQTVIRTAFAFLFCAIGCSLILSGSGTNVLTYVFFIIGLMVYFAYELITTKKLPNIVKFLPSWLYLVLLCAVFVSGVLLLKTADLSVSWDTDRIRSVSITADREQGHPRYEDLKMNEIQIEDETFLRMISEILEDRQALAKKSADLFNANNLYRYRMVRVTMKDGKTHLRYLWLSDRENEQFEKFLLNAGIYDAVYGERPQYPASVSMSDLSLTKEQTMALYEIYEKEVSNLNMHSWIYLNTGSSLFTDSSGKSFLPISGNIMGFEVNGLYGVTQYSNFYPLTALTPETYSAYLAYLNSSETETFSRLWEELVENPADQSNGYIEVDFVAMPGSRRKFDYYCYFNADYSKLTNEDAFCDIVKKLDEAIKVQGDHAPDLNSQLCKILFIERGQTESGSLYGREQVYVVAISEELEQALYDYNYMITREYFY